MPLAKPTPIESFFQANLSDGYGYLDARGGLIRQFQRTFRAWTELPENGSTLHFSDPTDPDFPIQELKIGYQLLWMHYPAPATNTAIRTETARIVDQACAIIEVSRFTRQGFRSYQVFSTDSVAVSVEALGALFPQFQKHGDLGKLIGLSWSGRFENGPLKSRVELSTVQRTQVVVSSVGVRREVEPDDDLPKFGVMLDIDIYDDRLSESRDVKPHFNRAFAFLNDTAVPFIVELLEEG
jgi:hypothetical protein